MGLNLLRAARAARRLAGRAARRLGRRGAALGWFATLDLAFAQSLADPVQQAQLRAAPSYRVILYVDPMVWAAAWLAVGLLCLVQAWMRDDRWAFAAQISLLWVWATLTILAIGPQAPRAIIGGLIWATFGGFVLVIAGWPEAPQPEAPRSGDG
jgi:hypothetical protein